MMMIADACLLAHSTASSLPIPEAAPVMRTIELVILLISFTV